MEVPISPVKNMISVTRKSHIATLPVGKGRPIEVSRSVLGSSIAACAIRRKGSAAPAGGLGDGYQAGAAEFANPSSSSKASSNGKYTRDVRSTRRAVGTDVSCANFRVLHRKH